MSKEKTKIAKTETPDSKLSVGFEAGVSLRAELIDKIHLGDSFEFLEGCPPNVFDLILEDMPYNTTACEWDVKIDLVKYWETRLRVLKPMGAIVLTASQPFTTILASSNLDMLKYEWIWNKKLAGNGILAKQQPLKIHENVLVFGNKVFYNPIKRKGVYRAKGGIKDEHGTFSNAASDITYNDEYYPESIIEFSGAGMRTDRIHPTQKPVGLFEYLIRTYTNEGDLVFDGFGGSGTTAVAAHKSKRNFIVIEKEKKYFDLATRRLRNERAQLTMF